MMRGSAALDDRGLGGRAAHVEHDQVVIAASARPSRAAPMTPPAGPEATTKTGLSLARLDAEHAAVGRHDQDRRSDAQAPTSLLGSRIR